MIRTLYKNLYSLQRAFLRKPTLSLTLFLSIFVLSALFITQLKVLTHVDDLIDSDFKTYDQLILLNKNFVNENSTSVFIKKKEPPFTKGDFCKITNWLTNIKINFAGLKYLITSSDIKKLDYRDHHFDFIPYLNLNCHYKENYDIDISSSIKKIQTETPWKNIISGKNFDDFVIEFYFKKASTQQYGKLDVKMVKEIKNSLENFFKYEEQFQFHWVGNGIFQYYFRIAYDKIAIINLLVMILLIFGFKYYFGTYKSGLIYIISISIATTIILGFMAFFGHPMDVLSNCISLMLFVSSIEDFMFLGHLRKKYNSWVFPFKKILLPSFLTSLTTFIGFGSLCFTDIAIIKRFGFWAAIGSLIEWAVIFLFLPALLLKFPKLQNWVAKEKHDQKENPLLSKIHSFEMPKSIALALLLLIPFSFFGASQIKVADAPQDIFPKSHPGKEAINYLKDSRGWKGQISLIFKDRTNEAFNRKVIQEYSNQDFVSAIENPYLIGEHLTNDFNSKGVSNLILKNWRKTAFAQKYHSKNSSETRAILFIKEMEISYIDNIIQYNKTLCPKNECFLAGSLISYSEFGSKVLSSLFKSFLLSLFFVALVLLVLTYHFKIKDKAAIIISALWGPLAIMSLFYILDVSITYITSLIAAIMVGLAGDNAIQFIFRKKNIYKDIVYYQNCSFFITICMIGISCSFFLSDFTPVRKLGFFMIAGFILNYIGDIFILKALVRKKDDKDKLTSK